MAHQTNDVKQFLDKAGVEALWERIYNGFAPRWQSYKPSNTASTADDRKPADFINTYTSDHIVNGVKDGRKSLDVNFISAGAIADAEGNKYGRDLIVQIPEVKAHSSATAGDGEYGVMSPDDKWKLDHVGTTAEDAVTIKGVKVGDADESTDANVRKLTISNDKFVNWDLVYNDTNNTLDIVDLNSASNVMTSVNVDDMLSDAIKKGFLTSVALVDKKDGETEQTGMYLKFIFTTGIGTDGASSESQTIYVDVKDLVDVYTAGDGITITNTGMDEHGNTTIDKIQRTGIISLKPAATGQIGGIKVYKDNSDNLENNPAYTVDARTSAISANVTGTNHRYFGVEIDKDDKAFVNVPITNITINDTNPEVKAATISPVTGGSFDIITDYNAVADQNSVDGWVITPTTATITVSKETDWSTTGNVGEEGKELEFGDTFTVFKDIVADGTNGHGTVKSNTTFTLPTETELSLGDAEEGADNNITTTYANVTETINGIANVPVSHQSIAITTSAVKSVDNHTIVCETTNNKFDICIPAIEESFIDSLVYRVQ